MLMTPEGNKKRGCAIPCGWRTLFLYGISPMVPGGEPWEAHYAAPTGRRTSSLSTGSGRPPSGDAYIYVSTASRRLPASVMLDLYICVTNKLQLIYPFCQKIGPDGIYGFFSSVFGVLHLTQSPMGTRFWNYINNCAPCRSFSLVCESKNKLRPLATER